MSGLIDRDLLALTKAVVGPLRFDHKTGRFYIEGDSYLHEGDLLWLNIAGRWRRYRVGWDSASETWYVLADGSIIRLEPEMYAARGNVPVPPSPGDDPKCKRALRLSVPLASILVCVAAYITDVRMPIRGWPSFFAWLGLASLGALIVVWWVYRDRTALCAFTYREAMKSFLQEYISAVLVVYMVTGLVNVLVFDPIVSWLGSR